VSVYRSSTDVRDLAEPETLSGEDALPGLALPLARLFRD
jgi:hypothetical protein